MRIPNWLLIIPVVLLGALFSIPNAHTVTLYYYFGQLEIRLALLLLLCLLLGVALTALINMGLILKLRNDKRRLEKARQTLEQENSRLRANAKDN